MWRARERWISADRDPAPSFPIMEWWDGTKAKEIAWFFDSHCEFELPVVCQSCYEVYQAHPIKYEELSDEFNFNQDSQAYEFACSSCGDWICADRKTTKRCLLISAQGDPRNIAIMGYWDGFQSSTTILRSTWAVGIKLLNAGSNSKIPPMPVLFIPNSTDESTSQLDILDAALEPFIRECVDLFVNGIHVDYAYPTELVDASTSLSRSFTLRCMLVMFSGDHPAQCKFAGFSTDGLTGCRRCECLSRWKSMPGVGLGGIGYLDPHVEVNRSNHESAQGECSSHPGLFDGLLATVQEPMESPSEEENSLGSLLAAIEQEAERHNSPPRQSQEQQLPVDSEDPRPERIPPEVSSQENNPPATSNANSPGNPQPPSVGIARGQPSVVGRPPLQPSATSRGTSPGQPSGVARPPLVPAVASRGTARGQPLVVGRPPRPPAAASRGTARGRGRAGQTTARQVIGCGSSRGTKRSADEVVVPFANARGEPVSKQARQDDDDTDVWADFAEYQAQAAANSKTKKWEAWLREAFMTETERAERMLRMIAEDKAQWDAIVATFPYSARNQFDNRVGYDPPDFVPIPKDPAEPPRPRTPPHVQIERIRAEYADGTRDRSLGYQPTCEHGLAWEDCPLCMRKPWPPMRCWTDEDLIAVAEKAQFYHDWNGRLAAERERSM
ncbi:hypothetical protein R1sor_000235 [Riccia sorocarpa]|uniref:Uncharacterized protein n=1 Tax=Riccia sorocarpa TaxID=122646 RepID=A0ABD3GSR5_9MARC